MNGEHEKTWKRKRFRSTIVFLWCSFLCGFEYTAILVSLLYYLMKYFDHQTANLMYSVCVAMEFVPCVFAGYIGKIVDKSGEMKKCLYIILAITGIGNLMYSMYFSIWFLIIGRFLVGFKLCLRSALAGELVRWYDEEKERSKILFYYQMLFSCGFIIGPASGVLFVNINFSIGHWEITKYNFVGIFLAILCLMTIFASIFAVHNLQNEFGKFFQESTSSVSFTTIICDPDIVVIMLTNGIIFFGACTFDLCIPLVGRDTLHLSLFQLSLSVVIAFCVFAAIVITCWTRFFSNENSLRGLVFCLFCQSYTGVLLLIANVLEFKSLTVKMALIIAATCFNSLGGIPAGISARELLFRLVPKESASYIDGVRTGVCFLVFALSGFFLASLIYSEILYTSPVICVVLLSLNVPLLVRKKSIFQRFNNEKY